MEDGFFVGGVALQRINEWLGEPLRPPHLSDPADRGDPRVSVRLMVGSVGQVQDVEPVDRETVRWDCLAFEKTFRAVHDLAASASRQDRDFVVHVLSTASQMHLFSQCRAERVGEDRWTVTHLCLKHLCERSAWMADRGGDEDRG